MNIQHFWPEWSVVALIGKGSYGNVYRIERKKGSFTFTSALKVIHIPLSQEEYHNLMTQGMDEMPNLLATAWDSSVSALATMIFPS